MVFKTENIDTARRATDNLDEDADTFMQWIRENIPREYKKSQDVEKAYDYISKADIFSGRIRRNMNWKLMKYVYSFSSIGVALAKEEKYDGWTKYQYPSKIRKMGSSRASRNKLEQIGKKIGTKLHISIDESVQTLPFLAQIIEDNPEVIDQLRLSDDEVEFIENF